MSSSDTPAIGHNGPPRTLSETLLENHADLIREVDDLAAKATTARNLLIDVEGGSPEVKNEDQRDALIKLGKDARDLGKKIEATSLATTKPYRDATDEIRAFFKTLLPRTDRILDAFEHLVGAFNMKQQDIARREAAERARLAKVEADRLLEEAAAAQHSVASDVIINQAVQADHLAQVAQQQALSAGTGPTRTEVGTVSTSRPWTFAVTDYSQIDLNDLRPYFSVADIDKALRSHTRTHKGTKPINGVTFFQDTKTSFR